MLKKKMYANLKHFNDPRVYVDEFTDEGNQLKALLTGDMDLFRQSQENIKQRLSPFNFRHSNTYELPNGYSKPGMLTGNYREAQIRHANEVAMDARIRQEAERYGMPVEEYLESLLKHS